jgi:YD repeat-containing protein
MKAPLLILLTLVLTLPQVHAVKVSYNYDAAGRLTAANYNGTSHTAYVYDKNGSLLSRTNTTNVIPSLAGTYNGILSNGTPEITNIGPITLKVVSNGSFTGKLTLGGTSYSFKGTFNADGTLVDAPIVITRKLPLNNLSLTLALDVTNGTGQITGSVTDTVFTSAIQIDRAGYNTKDKLLPAGLIGKYTALFLPTEMTAGIPQGDGYATVSVNNSGAIMLAGKLANNVGITQSSSFAGTNLWPLFVGLHANKGFLSGLVTFDTDPGMSDFDAYMTWVKPVTTGTIPPRSQPISLSSAPSGTLRPKGSGRSPLPAPAPIFPSMRPREISPPPSFSTSPWTRQTNL